MTTQKKIEQRNLQRFAPAAGQRSRAVLVGIVGCLLGSLTPLPASASSCSGAPQLSLQTPTAGEPGVSSPNEGQISAARVAELGLDPDDVTNCSEVRDPKPLDAAGDLWFDNDDQVWTDCMNAGNESESQLQSVNGPAFASDYGGCIPAADFQQFQCLVLDQSATFCDAAESYNVTVLVAESDVTLDCKNAEINHDFPQAPEGECGCSSNNVFSILANETSDSRRIEAFACKKPKARDGTKAEDEALLQDWKVLENGVFPKARQAVRLTRHRSLRNVTIRNCRVRNVGHDAVSAVRDFRGDELLAPLLVGHENLSIENLQTENTRYGVYVGQASRGTRIVDSSFVRPRHMGIYIEAGTQGGVFADNTIAFAAYREGIAVDSSSNNMFLDNVFAQNCKGAMTFYHNCGEIQGRVCPIERPTNASGNYVANNRFLDDEVWVGFRQGKDTPAGLCIVEDGAATYYEDFADGNMFVDNVFRFGTQGGLRVKDDDTMIVGNLFTPWQDEDVTRTPIQVEPGKWKKNQSDDSNMPNGFEVAGTEIWENEFRDTKVNWVTRTSGDQNGDNIEDVEPPLLCSNDLQTTTPPAPTELPLAVLATL